MRRRQVYVYAHTYIHMYIERADEDHMSQDTRLERAVTTGLAAGSKSFLRRVAVRSQRKVGPQ